MAAKRVCSIEGCDKPHLANGWCSAHYTRARKYNDPLGSAPSKVKRLCSVDGCQQQHDAKGFCATHYASWRRHGDPLSSERNKSQLGLKKCSVPGCDKKYYGNDLCAMHNYRNRKHGSPLSGRTFNGDAEKYFSDVVLKCRSEDCLIWPYTRNKRGYAVMARHGQKRTMLVHRLACEARHGPPPNSKNQAAHSCGEGHNGCVNPSHTRWDNHIGNEADKLEHGTSARKLSDSDVIEIRKLSTSMTQKALALKFGVRPQTIWALLHGKTFRWLKG